MLASGSRRTGLGGRPLALAGWLLVVGGCGAVSHSGTGHAPTDVSGRSVSAACNATPKTIEDASTLIVLDWSGGPSPLDATTEISALGPADLPILGVPGAGTATEPFEEAVRRQVEAILCGLDPVDMRVVCGHAADWPDATRVYFTSDVAPHGGQQVGQGGYDPCNRQPNDHGIIWGGRLVEAAGGPHTAEEWANMLANVAAHEIGHTLGFAHADEFLPPEDATLAAREVMLSSHTILELCVEQAFLVPQETCPVESVLAGAGVRYQVTGDSGGSTSATRATAKTPASEGALFRARDPGASGSEASAVRVEY